MPAFDTADKLPHKGTLSIHEAALETGLSEGWLRIKIRSGELNAYKRIWRYGVYRRAGWFIPVTELKRWMIDRITKQVYNETIKSPPSLA